MNQRRHTNWSHGSELAMARELAWCCGKHMSFHLQYLGAEQIRVLRYLGSEDIREFRLAYLLIVLRAEVTPFCSCVTLTCRLDPAG